MEFNINLAATPDVDGIEHAIRVLDPSAQVDFNSQSLSMRVATAIDASALVAVICGSGTAVTELQVTQIPSLCCGGCGG